MEDCFQKSHNTGGRTAEENTRNRLEDQFPLKLSDVSNTNPTFTVELQLLNL
jgi:hypothetical protein